MSANRRGTLPAHHSPRPAKLGTTTPHVTVEHDPTLVYFGVPDDTDDGLDGERTERRFEHGPESDTWGAAA